MILVEERMMLFLNQHAKKQKEKALPKLGIAKIC
jgi:hypothetical protein